MFSSSIPQKNSRRKKDRRKNAKHANKHSKRKRVRNGRKGTESRSKGQGTKSPGANGANSTPPGTKVQGNKSSGTNATDNQFEHFLSDADSGPIGATGSFEKVKIKDKEIARIGGLVFDIDMKHFHVSFRQRVRAYVKAVLPEAELRQTSAAGNMHAILHFKRPIGMKMARNIWELARRLLFSDPHAGFQMKARVVGSRKVKEDGETFVVTHVRAGQSVLATDLLQRLNSASAGGVGGSGAVAAWRQLQFRTLLMVLQAGGRPLWDGQSSHGVCPLHGSGKNPKQCKIEADQARCACFGDCASNGRPKQITLPDIIQECVIDPGEWNDCKDWYVLPDAEEYDGPIVIFSSIKPMKVYYSDVLRELQVAGDIYQLGNTVVEINDDQIRPILDPSGLVGAVASRMEIAVEADGKRTYRRMAKEDASAILHGKAFLEQLPAIECFAELPVYDQQLNLAAPGYNEAARIYCASKEIKPAQGCATLSRFLDVISFKDRASRANYVGCLLTLLFPLDFHGNKPAAIFDANRQGVGKTMLARCLARLATKQHITTATYNGNDEEFEKTIAAKSLQANYVLIDNAKLRRSNEVSSAVLERSITDPQLSYRRLGQNSTIERPNGVLWMLSMNNTMLSPDLMDRGLPIRLYFEGDPSTRRSVIGDPEDYFTEHRTSIIAELLGMVEEWKQQDCPMADHSFRFQDWARRIGGIVAASGIPGFLDNYRESRLEMDPVLRGLHVLAEHLPDTYKKAGEWLVVAKAKDVLQDTWAFANNDRAATTSLGKLFRSYKGQVLDVKTEEGETRPVRLQDRSEKSGTAWGFIITGPDGGGRDEPGEPATGGSSTGSSQITPENRAEVQQGEHSEPKSNSLQKVDSNAYISDTTALPSSLGDNPQTGSPGSPSTQETPLSGQNRRFEGVNLPAEVHPRFPQHNHPRYKALEHLRRQHPRSHNAQAATTGQNASSAQHPVPERTTDLDGESVAFTIGWDGVPFGTGILALDTETTLITADGEVPALVLATASDGERHVVIEAGQVADFIVAHGHHTLVFHNAGFDFWVLEQHCRQSNRQDASEVLFRMARGHQLRDTMLLDSLLRLAQKGDRPVPRDLGTLAEEYAEIVLDKNDPYRQRYGEIQGQLLAQVEPGFLSYAIKDAIATIYVYAGLFVPAQDVMEAHCDLYDPALAANFGLLTEQVQVQAAIALAAISHNGLCVDQQGLARLRKELQQRRDDLVTQLDQIVQGDRMLSALKDVEGDSIFQRDKQGPIKLTDTGAPRCHRKALQAVLRAIGDQLKQSGVDAKVPQTEKSGELSQKTEHWAPLRDKHPFIRQWLELNELTKLLQFTQLEVDCVHPRYQVMVRTGRTSCAKPNIQQLPRNGGIRECFVASPGHYLLAIDYEFIELRTLAAICEHRYGKSKLADVIRDSIDPHCYTAALIRGMSLEAFMQLKDTDPATFKNDRQRAKAVNFGVPGGLGAKSLVNYAANTFGVTLTMEEATQLRDRLINEVYPELGRYLDRDGGENLMVRLAHALGTSEAACWNTLFKHNDRPEWLPLAVRNVVRGCTMRRDGQPYDQQWYADIWQSLRRLNRIPDLATKLNPGCADDQLARRLFDERPVASLTGRLRARASFTEAHNTPFQALAADGAKLALFELVAQGYRVVAFVHDEVLIELPTDADHTAAARKIDEICCAAMRRVTGDVPICCGPPALMGHWAKDAEAVYDGQGRLRLWQP